VTSLAKSAAPVPTRKWPRYSNLKDLSLTYEGRSDVFPIRPPDISPTGMFINTAADFPEGAILKVSFRLAKSNHPISVRCEVRYCLTGVGIGVEFVGMSTEDQKAIAKETHTPGLTFKRLPDMPNKKRNSSAKKKPTPIKKKIATRKKSAPRRKKR
jgi:PilZ domain-containing protein